MKTVDWALLDREDERRDLWRVVFTSVGNKVATPALMAGRHAHNMAAAVSTVEQRVAGTLSHVASILNPKCRRLLRRMIDVIQTLIWD
jgi:hypothetical protein